MTITRKFSTVIIDLEKISEVNKILVENADSTTQSSSHVIFNLEPINVFENLHDLSFFRIYAEDERNLKNKLDIIIDQLNQQDIDYSIRDEETKEMYTTITSVGALDIKFDNINNIPEGTYKKIDELKNLKTEFGYCKGYKPTFRPIESKDIGNIEVKPETIYLLSRTEEDQKTLKSNITEKIMEINPDFKIEYRLFMRNLSKFKRIE